MNTQPHFSGYRFGPMTPIKGQFISKKFCLVVKHSKKQRKFSQISALVEIRIKTLDFVK